MNLAEQIAPKIVAAMKAKDETTLNTLRGIKMALDKHAKEVGTPITEEVEQKLLEKMVKQRLDSISQFEKGNRADLVAREQAELAVIRQYMPQDASPERIEMAVTDALAEEVMALPGPATVLTMKNMGSVMKRATAKLAGWRVDGKVLSTLIKAKLA